MRVLLVHEFYRSSAPSGEDDVFRNESIMLENSDIDVCTYNVYNDDIDDSTLLKRVRLGLQTIWSRVSYRKFTEVLQSIRPDIVHFHNTFPLLSPSVYKSCRDNDLPVVQTLHNFRLVCPGALLQRVNKPCEDCLSGSIFNSVRHRCYRGSLMATLPLTCMISYNRLVGSYKNVNRYIALTNFAASRMIRGGMPPDRISVKPNFLPDPPSPVYSKKDYLVYTGRLSEEKGIWTLLKSWTQIPDIPLHILGDGPLRDKAIQFSKEHNLPVTFHGAVKRKLVIDIVKYARAQIIPSEWYEGFPMVILEAFACGTPVLASSIGSLDELIDEGVTGYKFSPGDVPGLVDCVRKIWNNKEKLHEMSLNARNIFDERYTEEKNLCHLTDIYNSVVNYKHR